MTDLEMKVRIEEAEKAVAEAEEQIAKAKTAGIDTTDLEAELAEAKAALTKLKEAFA